MAIPCSPRARAEAFIIPGLNVFAGVWTRYNATNCRACSLRCFQGSDVLSNTCIKTPNPPLFGLQEALRGLLYRKAGMHDGKMRKDILYADFVLRESARQASVANSD